MVHGPRGDFYLCCSNVDAGPVSAFGWDDVSSEQLFLLRFELSFADQSFGFQVSQFRYLVGGAVRRLGSGCGFLLTSCSPYKGCDPTQDSPAKEKVKYKYRTGILLFVGHQ